MPMKKINGDEPRQAVNVEKMKPETNKMSQF